MLKFFFLSVFIFSFIMLNAQIPEKDVFETAEGPLEIHFVGHGSLYFSFQEKIIHVDPYSKVADYARLPKADLIMITHEHRDHLDTIAMNAVMKENTEILLTEICFGILQKGKVIRNGEKTELLELPIEAVPAYNIVHKRDNGQPFHPKGAGNGYVIRFADLNVYVGADTENIPEMAELQNIDVAFLPMNLPYTMTPEMVALAARSFKPGILYPYHFGQTNTAELVKLLADTPEVEVRIRKF
ncbi:MAG TPA: metal-dependent hydrolase [Saprospirales bacterium]|nr:metal-dependent hydrolase [Saprospirales bacterium]